MTPPVLLLVRHAAPQVDPRQPASAWPLSDAGRQGSRALAPVLAGYAPACAYSSPEAKSLETASLALPGMQPRVLDDLREHERRGLGWTSRADFESAVQRFFAWPRELVFGDETADQAHARFAAALRGALEQSAGAPVAVFTHGTVLTLYVSRLAGLEPFAFWRRLGMPACVVLSLPGQRLLRVIEPAGGQPD